LASDSLDTFDLTGALSLVNLGAIVKELFLKSTCARPVIETTIVVINNQINFIKCFYISNKDRLQK
jgi:hypothetical protein